MFAFSCLSMRWNCCYFDSKTSLRCLGLLMICLRVRANWTMCLKWPDSTTIDLWMIQSNSFYIFLCVRIACVWVAGFRLIARLYTYGVANLPLILKYRFFYIFKPIWNLKYYFYGFTNFITNIRKTDEIFVLNEIFHFVHHFQRFILVINLELNFFI